MKRKISGRVAVMFAVIAIICILPGCAQNYEIDMESESKQNAAEFSGYSYDREKAQKQYARGMAISERGYYYTAGNILYFYDIKSDTNTAMCSNAGCSHKDNNCAAYVSAYAAYAANEMKSWNCHGKEVFYYDGRIYMVECTGIDDAYYLNRYDKNFNNTERVARLSSYRGEDKNVTFMVNSTASVISEGYMYYLTYSFDPDMVASKKSYVVMFNCMRVKLETGAAPERLGGFESLPYGGVMASEAGQSVVRCKEDIYFIVGGTQTDHVTSDTVNYRVARYSIKDGQFEMLWTYTGDIRRDVWGEETNIVNIDSNVCMDEQGNMFLLNSGSGDRYDTTGIVMANFDGNICKTVYKTEFDSIGQLACDGKYLYLTEYGREANYITALDTQGNLVNRFEIGYNEEFEKFEKSHGHELVTGEVQIYGADDRYLLIGALQNGYKNLSAISPIKSYVMDSPTIMCGVGVLDKSGFLNKEEVEIKQIFQYK